MKLQEQLQGQKIPTFLPNINDLQPGEGAKRAAVAIAHQILKISYYIIRDKQRYIELGPDHYENTRRERTARNSIKKLEKLGYKVSVEEIA